MKVVKDALQRACPAVETGSSEVVEVVKKTA